MVDSVLGDKKRAQVETREIMTKQVAGCKEICFVPLPPRFEILPRAANHRLLLVVSRKGAILTNLVVQRRSGAHEHLREGPILFCFHKGVCPCNDARPCCAWALWPWSAVAPWPR